MYSVNIDSFSPPTTGQFLPTNETTLNVAPLDMLEIREICVILNSVEKLRRIADVNTRSTAITIEESKIHTTVC